MVYLPDEICNRDKQSRWNACSNSSVEQKRKLTRFIDNMKKAARKKTDKYFFANAKLKNPHCEHEIAKK